MKNWLVVEERIIDREEKIAEYEKIQDYKDAVAMGRPIVKESKRFVFKGQGRNTYVRGNN